MIVLGLIGRPDSKWCHDATAALIVDGTVVSALEQERISCRRYAQGEGAQDAVEVLLADAGLRPSDVDAIGYAWADADPAVSRVADSTLAGGALATDKMTSAILPRLAGQLGNREIIFFDHHLCHAAETYWFNPFSRAAILVADGMGGAGATSLFLAEDGKFKLLDRYDHAWSLGIFYEAAAYYAGLGWDAAGKLMGLSSYGTPSGRRFITFDANTGAFALDPSLRGMPPSDLREDGLAHAWISVFEASVFPYAAGVGNTFDYATFAADVQVTLEEIGLALARRLRQRTGAEALLLAGGVALNAHLNRLLVRCGEYRAVASTAAPHDGGAAVGAGLLAATLLGEPVRLAAVGDPPRIFLGPEVSARRIERAIARAGCPAVAFDDDSLRKQVARALGEEQVVAYFDGPIELGPRALGARSLLAAPRPRLVLDRLNRIKGRAPWWPAVLVSPGRPSARLTLNRRRPG